MRTRSKRLRPYKQGKKTGYRNRRRRGVVGSSDLVRMLVNKTGAPCCHTLMAAGVLGYSERLNYGLVGMHGSFVTNKAIDEADVLVAIGTRFSDRVALNTNRLLIKQR